MKLRPSDVVLSLNLSQRDFAQLVIHMKHLQHDRQSFHMKQGNIVFVVCRMVMVWFGEITCPSFWNCLLDYQRRPSTWTALLLAIRHEWFLLTWGVWPKRDKTLVIQIWISSWDGPSVLPWCQQEHSPRICFWLWSWWMLGLQQVNHNDWEKLCCLMTENKTDGVIHHDSVFCLLIGSFAWTCWPLKDTWTQRKTLWFLDFKCGLQLFTKSAGISSGELEMMFCESDVVQI